MHLVFVTTITKNYGYWKWIAWRHQAITFHADSEVQWYSPEVNFTGDTSTTFTNISFKIAHLNIQIPQGLWVKINILPIKITKEIYFHKVTSA